MNLEMSKARYGANSTKKKIQRTTHQSGGSKRRMQGLTANRTRQYIIKQDMKGIRKREEDEVSS
jgi:hypothetical protein